MNITENKKIVAIALPLIIQQLSLQMKMWVDNAMLGHVNPMYFSAIGNVMVPYHVALSVISAICGGTTILIAQSMGAKNEEKAKTYGTHSFVGNSILPILAFLFFFLVPDLLFRFMGVQEPILERSTAYLRIFAFTFLFVGPVTTAISIMQGIGVTKIIMIGGLISNMLNILLNWLLIFGNLGFSEMGLVGAALSATISMGVNGLIITGYLFLSKKIPFKFKILEIMGFRFRIYKEVLALGLPSSLEFALWNVGNLIVLTFLNQLNMMAAGIYTLIFSIEIFPVLLSMGFANAAVTLVGQRIGENKERQAIIVGFKCLGFSLLVAVAIIVVFLTIPEQILGIFTDDSNFIAQTLGYLLIVSFTILPKTINNVIGLSIRGLGDAKWMLYSQIFGTVFVVTVSYLLVFVAGMGLMGVFVTFLIDESIRGIVNSLRFWKGREVFFLKPFGRESYHLES